MPNIIEIDAEKESDDYRCATFSEFLDRYLPNEIFTTRPVFGPREKWWQLNGPIVGTAIVMRDAVLGIVLNEEPNTVISAVRYQKLVTVLAELYEEHNPEITVTIEVQKVRPGKS